MTENERELINLIRENDEPEKALCTAVETILLYLKQHGSYQEPTVADLQEFA